MKIFPIANGNHISCEDSILYDTKLSSQFPKRYIIIECDNIQEAEELKKYLEVDLF